MKEHTHNGGKEGDMERMIMEAKQNFNYDKHGNMGTHSV
jgi:hypothetical protein